MDDHSDDGVKARGVEEFVLTRPDTARASPTAIKMMYSLMPVGYWISSSVDTGCASSSGSTVCADDEEMMLSADETWSCTAVEPF